MSRKIAMPYYNCKVADTKGKVSIIKYHANSIEDVKTLVQRDNYLLLECNEVYTFSPRTRKKLELRDFITFNQELFVLIKAGQSLVKALEIILEKLENKSKFYKVLEIVKKDVQQGNSLSDALERHTDYFPTLYIANVRAGEKGGNLVERLKDYQTYIKKMDELQRKIVSSAVYPIVILIVIIIAVAFLFTYVIPNFSKIYLDAKVELPLITKTMLLITDMFRYLLPFFIFFGFLLFFGYRSYTKKTEGRLLIDRLKLNIPFVSPIYKNYLLSNFSRTLSAILKGGIPLVAALKTATGVIDNAYYAAKLNEATKKVEEGNSLSSSLEETGLFPSIAVRLVKAGEGTGELWTMLDEVSDYYDTLVNDALTTLTTLVEPALMIVMGVVVGTIVIAMYLPIFSLATAVGG